MECAEIRNKLSAHIEGEVSPEEKSQIDEHLRSCMKCSEALADLKKTVEYVHNLEEVEPPPWLTQKVMARVKAGTETRKGFFQKLFYPLHVKLPIQAVATIAIAVITVYIIKTLQPEIKSETRTVLTPQISQEEKTGIILQEKAKSQEKPADIPADLQATRLGPADKEISGKEEKIPTFRESETVPAKPSKQPVPSEEPETQDRFADVHKAPSPVVSQEEDMPFSDAVAKDESRQETLSKEYRARALAEKTEEGLVLAINVINFETARTEVENAVKKLGGKIIKTESLEDKDVIITDLDSKKLKALIDKIEIIEDEKGKGVALKILESSAGIIIEIEKTAKLY